MNKVYSAIVNDRLQSPEDFAKSQEIKAKAGKRPLEDEDIRRVWLQDPVTQDLIVRLREQMGESLQGCVASSLSFLEEAPEISRNHGARASTTEGILKLILFGKNEQPNPIIGINQQGGN